MSARRPVGHNHRAGDPADYRRREGGTRLGRPTTCKASPERPDRKTNTVASIGVIDDPRCCSCRRHLVYRSLPVRPPAAILRQVAAAITSTTTPVGRALRTMHLVGGVLLGIAMAESLRTAFGISAAALGMTVW